MKSFEQLAEVLYRAYWREHRNALPGFTAEFPPLPWSEISQTTEKHFWVAAAKELWAEFQTLQ